MLEDYVMTAAAGKSAYPSQILHMLTRYSLGWHMPLSSLFLRQIPHWSSGSGRGLAPQKHSLGINNCVHTEVSKRAELLLY